VNHIETADEVAARIEAVEKKVGAGRVRWVHPDCGFWMLKRSIADRKMEALVRGRDKRELRAASAFGASFFARTPLPAALSTSLCCGSSRRAYWS
jgi:hypothetical protein